MGGSKKLIGLLMIGAATVGMSSIAAAGKGGGGKPAAQPAASSITINQAARQAGDLTFGQAVTFTTVATGLGGDEYPLVYLECVNNVDGSVLYGQLDLPEVVFQIGGGSIGGSYGGGSIGGTTGGRGAVQT